MTTKHQLLLNDLEKLLSIISQMTIEDFKHIYDFGLQGVSEALSSGIVKNWAQIKIQSAGIRTSWNRIDLEQESHFEWISRILDQAAILELKPVDEMGLSNCEATRFYPAVLAILDGLKQLADLQDDTNRAYKGFDISKLGKMVRLIDSSTGLQSKAQLENAFYALNSKRLIEIAFLLDVKRPLYFAIVPYEYNGLRERIHLNFKSLSDKLSDVSKGDLMKLSETFKYNYYPESDPDEPVWPQSQPNLLTLDDRICAKNLLKEYSDFKFHSLGFLVEMMERSETQFNPPVNGPFMKYHAQRESFSFIPLSINDVKKFYDNNSFRNYVVLLEEFVGHPWILMVKNLMDALDVLSMHSIHPNAVI